MRKLELSLVAVLTLAWLSACVTINVYFPAAAAEKAADKIIDKVWGEEGREPEKTPQPETGEPAANGKQSRLGPLDMLGHGLTYLVTPAHAEADLNISTPAISALEKRMSARHQQLEAYYDNGAIGLTNDGLIVLRDPGAVPLPARNKTGKAIEEENQDRLALYREIAVANGHPEWEGQIRQTFAARWIGKAKKGWWYQDERGNWLRK
jgi:uncharacterized protein YdbL (DUF1318 family)